MAEQLRRIYFSDPPPFILDEKLDALKFKMNNTRIVLFEKTKHSRQLPLSEIEKKETYKKKAAFQ